MRYLQFKVPECVEDVASQIASQEGVITPSEWWQLWLMVMIAKSLEDLVGTIGVGFSSETADREAMVAWWNDLVAAGRARKAAKGGSV